jgi:hypothetical protein
VDFVFLRHPALGVQIMVLHHLVLQFPSISSRWTAGWLKMYRCRIVLKDATDAEQFYLL